jgi:hypothetical protein
MNVILLLLTGIFRLRQNGMVLINYLGDDAGLKLKEAGLPIGAWKMRPRIKQLYSPSIRLA